MTETNTTLTPETLAEIEARNTLVFASKTFARIATRFDLPQKKVLDIGCGYGEFMQRFAPGSVGITTTPEEVTYGAYAKRDIRLGNVEELESILKPEERFDVVWCNNILEHLLSPHAFLVQLKKYATPDTVLIIGTPMVPSIAAMTKLKRFRGALASPHINFFTRTTYRLTATYAGWQVRDLNPFHFSSDILNHAVAPIAPHLYLVAKNNPHYRYPEKKMKEWQHAAKYQPLIQIMGNSLPPNQSEPTHEA